MEDKKLYNAVRKIITLADGRQIEIETGKLAKQADGSVVVKQGDTMLLATVVAAKDAKPDTDFMPLQVEYKEKYASCGRYPGGFMKREGRANDSEILVARLIDRALRPLFPADYHAEVYVTVNLISADKDIQPDALAGLAASAALAVSDIPFGGPISEVRVARLDGEYVINPNFSEMDRVRPRHHGRRYDRQHPDGRRRDEGGFGRGDARSHQVRTRGDQEALRRTDRAFEGAGQGRETHLLPRGQRRGAAPDASSRSFTTRPTPSPRAVR